MVKEISVYIIVTISFLGLLSSLPPAFLARAQTTSSNSTIISFSIFSSPPIPNTNTMSATGATIAQNATTSSTQTPASITVSTTTNSTSTGTVASSTQATSTTAVSTSISLATTTSGITSSAQSTTSSSSNISPSTTNSTLVSSSTTTTSTGDSPTTSISASTASSSTTSTSTSDTGSAGYSISFSPAYWLCNDVSVTFTGPLIESGLYGDTLQFQYFQYSASYPSVLNPIFTDSGLTVTSDTVNYWINYNEYAPVNFAYMPNIAVKVVDVTPKSNGYMPGQIFMELTNLTPEGYQYCQIAAPAPIPEFQAEWMIVMVTVALGLAFLQAHNHRGSRLMELTRDGP